MFVYADNAATTKMRLEAKLTMDRCYNEFYGNPSSLHKEGVMAKEALDEARHMVAKILGCADKDVYFTSSGSESDNQAILTAAEIGAQENKRHIVTTAFEHHAVLNTLKELEKDGYEVTYLKPSEVTHNISADQVEAAIRPDTCLVTTMYANNEIGSILPICEIGKICKEAGVLFHVDAVQAVGHIPVSMKRDNIDMLSASAHKFQGPKGVGILCSKVKPKCIVHGGGQENGVRAGTENVPGICATAIALSEANVDMGKTILHAPMMRDKLINELSKIPGSYVNGDPNHRLPGTVSICFDGIEAESLLLLLDDRGICVSAGSACSAGSLEPSHVLKSIGRSDKLARGAIRISLNENNRMADADYIIKCVNECVGILRRIAPSKN